MKSQNNIKLATTLLFLVWTLLLGMLLFLSTNHFRQTTRDIALAQARVFFNKDLAFRQWVSNHGGLYVPITEQSPPNPYLSHIAKRDIVDPDGIPLTLLNPAYATRQINEAFFEEYGVNGNITSQKLLRPENAPDEWELAALKRFDLGEKEVFEFTKIEGEPFLRLIKPLMTQQGCLKCHAHQGYKVNDVRGGTGIVLPIASLTSQEYQSVFMVKISLFILWLFGSILILFGHRKLSAANKERDEVLEDVEVLLEKRTTHLQEAIIAQKAVEIQLRDATEFAIAANETKSSFLANMSHEIRTPMNAIIGLTELAVDTELNPEQADYLHKIQYSSTSLLSIINDILDFSKIEAGKFNLEQVDFSPADLISAMSAMFSSLAKDKGLELFLDLDSSLPVALQGDPARLNQVLINLLSNAVKFSDKGEVKLLIEQIDQKDDTVKVRFSVIDSGIGMDKEVQERIFTSFSQADTSHSRKYGGTGLGLSISKKLVELMGGTITVDSAVGRGSLFSFILELPVGDEAGVVALGSLGQQISGLPSDKDPVLLRGCRILLVEDNEINQQVALEKLRRKGMVVDLAINGQEGVKAATAGDYDAILMDIQMPVMDGYRATAAIREQQAAANVEKRIPIIAMTANAMTGDKKKSLQAGMDDHISKPIDTNLLYHTLLHWINPVPNATMKSTPAMVEQEDTEVPLPNNLPGLEIGNGLNNMEGNSALYRKLLANFLRDYEDVANKISAALTESDHIQARLLSHTVKGVSGNLGAVDLYKAATLLEKGIGANDDCGIAELVDNFNSQLHIVMESIRELPLHEEQPDKSAQKANVDVQKIILQVTELDHLLKKNNFQAVSKLTDLKSSLQALGLGDELTGLEKYIDKFAFQQAREVVNDIQQKLAADFRK